MYLERKVVEAMCVSKMINVIHTIRTIHSTTITTCRIGTLGALQGTKQPLLTCAPKVLHIIVGSPR